MVEAKVALDGLRAPPVDRIANPLRTMRFVPNKRSSTFGTGNPVVGSITTPSTRPGVCAAAARLTPMPVTATTTTALIQRLQATAIVLSIPDSGRS